MSLFWQTVTNLSDNETTLRRRRFGVIEMRDGRFNKITLRPFPKLISEIEARWIGRWVHRNTEGDRCWLYYNQPLGSHNYLSLQYLVSSRHCSMASARGALAVLDRVAQIKNTAAIVCHGNELFSDRLPERWGWERHMLDYPGRHFIKRFYGDFSRAMSPERYLTPSN